MPGVGLARIVGVEVDHVAAEGRAVERPGDQPEHHREPAALVAADRQQQPFGGALRVDDVLAGRGVHHPARLHRLALQRVVLHRAVGDDRRRHVEHERPGAATARRTPADWCRAADRRRPTPPCGWRSRPPHTSRSCPARPASRHRGRPAPHGSSGARRPTTRRSRAPARSRFRPRASSPGGPCRCRRRPARSRARCAFTVMFGRGLKPPAFRRRTYCGSRNTPCASAPVRSASPISSAHLAASSRGSPAAASASVISAADRRDRHAFDWLIACPHKSLSV